MAPELHISHTCEVRWIYVCNPGCCKNQVCWDVADTFPKCTIEISKKKEAHTEFDVSDLYWPKEHGAQPAESDTRRASLQHKKISVNYRNIWYSIIYIKKFYLDRSESLVAKQCTHSCMHNTNLSCLRKSCSRGYTHSYCLCRVPYWHHIRHIVGQLWEHRFCKSNRISALWTKMDPDIPACTDIRCSCGFWTLWAGAVLSKCGPPTKMSVIYKVIWNDDNIL